MYGEPFDIPAPDTLVFISWYQGGEVFRSGCAYQRGRGKIFYFSPGHETLPIYYQSEVQQVISNAVRWTAPLGWPAVPVPSTKIRGGHRPEPLEDVPRFDG
jgi:trehalose utilization protein